MLITGARLGIGAATAVAMARAGARVAVTSRDATGLDDVVSRVAAAGSEALPLALDVRDTTGVEAAVGAVADHFGRIDLLVNNAAMSIRKPALELGENDWDVVMDTNLKGAFFTAQAAVRRMRESGGGRIINLSTPFARVPSRGCWRARGSSYRPRRPGGRARPARRTAAFQRNPSLVSRL